MLLYKYYRSINVISMCIENRNEQIIIKIKWMGLGKRGLFGGGGRGQGGGGEHFTPTFIIRRKVNMKTTM